MPVLSCLCFKGNLGHLQSAGFSGNSGLVVELSGFSGRPISGFPEPGFPVSGLPVPGLPVPGLTVPGSQASEPSPSSSAHAPNVASPSSVAQKFPSSLFSQKT